MFLDAVLVYNFLLDEPHERIRAVAVSCLCDVSPKCRDQHDKSKNTIFVLPTKEESHSLITQSNHKLKRE